jgi:capsular polysaccharide biosynthesis protein
VNARASSRRLAGDYPDLRAVAFAARRGWWAIVLCALAFAALAEVAGSRGEVRYEAATGVLVGPLVGDPASVRAAADRGPTYADLANSRRVVAAARARLGLRDSVERLVAAVSADADGSSRLLTITAQTATADTAARLANAIAAELGPTVFRDARTAAREFHHIDPAVAPRAPITSHRRILTVFAALAGALAGLTLLLLVEYFRGRVTTAGELSEISRAPLLATLPIGRAATGFDVLAARITLAAGGTAPRSILVTGDGAPDVADGLADAIERGGEPVARIPVAPRAMPASIRSAMRLQGDRRIVLDAPAADRFPGAVACTRLVDATLLVARRGRTHRESAAQSAATLREAGGTVVGVALVVRAGWYDRWNARPVIRVGRSRPAAHAAEPAGHARAIVATGARTSGAGGSGDTVAARTPGGRGSRRARAASRRSSQAVAFARASRNQK